MKYNYKCVVAKNGGKMYYKQVSSKWKRISNNIGIKAEKGKMKYRNGEGSKDIDKCAICLGELAEDEDLEKLVCGHTYHKECIIDWEKIEKICPYCRQPLIYKSENSRSITYYELGEKLLDLSSKNKNIDIVKLLIEEGADINFKGGDYDESPLITASTYGAEKIVKELLGFEDIDIDRNGLLALDRSITDGNEVIVKLLLEKGVKIPEGHIPQYMHQEEIIRKIIDDYSKK